MKQGDFSALAKEYKNRAGYSQLVLGVLCDYTGAEKIPGFRVADIGAGTGKLTEELLLRKLNVVAVEPNDEMRAEGVSITGNSGVQWLKGSGGDTRGLPVCFVRN